MKKIILLVSLLCSLTVSASWTGLESLDLSDPSDFLQALNSPASEGETISAQQLNKKLEAIKLKIKQSAGQIINLSVTSVGLSTHITRAIYYVIDDVPFLYINFSGTYSSNKAVADVYVDNLTFKIGMHQALSSMNHSLSYNNAYVSDTGTVIYSRTGSATTGHRFQGLLELESELDLSLFP